MRDADPARRLLRALRRSAAEAGADATAELLGTTPWSSATFVGAQHRVTVTGARLDAWLAALPEAELPMPGRFVASVEVVPTTDGAELLILVLDG